MNATGWWGEAPEAAPAMPLTERLLRMQHREPGDTLQIAMARSRAADARQAAAEAARAVDPDEYAANLVGRGYAPGMISQLTGRLSDTVAELESERAKVEAGVRNAERVERMRAAGLPALECWRRLDGDWGDEAQAERLERRAESLRAQLADATQIAVPPEARAANAVEEAATRAQRILADVAAQRWAEDEAERVERARLKAQRAAFRRERRPFAGGSAAGEPAVGWDAVRAQDAAGRVVRRGVEGAIVGVR